MLGDNWEGGGISKLETGKKQKPKPNKQERKSWDLQ